MFSVAKRDEHGFYRVLGRPEDLIVPIGKDLSECVSVYEIEGLIGEHEAVIDSAIISLPTNAAYKNIAFLLMDCVRLLYDFCFFNKFGQQNVLL